MVLSKSDIPRPTLPAETIQVDELGGEVIVQGLRLRDRVQVGAAEASDRPHEIARILSLTVVDANRNPIYTADEWEDFGCRQSLVAFRLLDIAMRLSGLKEGEDSEKKGSPPN